MPGMKPGMSTSVTSGMLNTLQKRMKRARLVRGINVQRAGFDGGIVGDDADDDALNAGEANDDVLRPFRLHFEKIAVVHQTAR